MFFAPGCKIYMLSIEYYYKYAYSWLVLNFYCIPIMWTYLWQNFLIDAKVRSYIADKILTLYHQLGCESLLEIWPGKWSITKLIQTISDHFFVVDMDPTFYDNWQLQIINWQFILSDILELDVEAMLKEKNLPKGQARLSPSKTLVVWNLPYYITSPILRKFFSAQVPGNWFAWGIFMVQDEVGQKIRSDAKKKSYLRWLLNFSCDVKYLKWVPAKCFKPVPKVKSCLIQLTNKNEQLPIDRDKFIEFLELFAPFSRKTLGAIQKMLNKKSDIQRHNEKSKLSENFHDVELVPKLKIVKSVGCISFEIPESLQKKRLEELDWSHIWQIIG